VEPFVELRIDYEGPVVLLTDPLEMADPRRAFTTNPTPTARCISSTAAPPRCSAVNRTSRTNRPGEEFARGHYEQLGAASGSIEVGDEPLDLDGFGLRDHSWARDTGKPVVLPLAHGNVGADFGFNGFADRPPDGAGTRGGFVWDWDGPAPLPRLQAPLDLEGDANYHRNIEAELITDDKTWVVRGSVLNLIPLRNRRRDPDANELVTRISEGLTEWTLEDGRGRIRGSPSTSTRSSRGSRSGLAE